MNLFGDAVHETFNMLQSHGQNTRVRSGRYRKNTVNLEISVDEVNRKSPQQPLTYGILHDSVAGMADYCIMSPYGLQRRLYELDADILYANSEQLIHVGGIALYLPDSNYVSEGNATTS